MGMKHGNADHNVYCLHIIMVVNSTLILILKYLSSIGLFVAFDNFQECIEDSTKPCKEET
jgi:hypothetical protein